MGCCCCGTSIDCFCCNGGCNEALCVGCVTGGAACCANSPQAGSGASISCNPGYCCTPNLTCDPRTCSPANAGQSDNPPSSSCCKQAPKGGGGGGGSAKMGGGGGSPLARPNACSQQTALAAMLSKFGTTMGSFLKGTHQATTAQSMTVNKNPFNITTSGFIIVLVVIGIILLILAFAKGNE